jgi:hypothetical protein
MLSLLDGGEAGGFYVLKVCNLASERGELLFETVLDVFAFLLDGGHLVVLVSSVDDALGTNQHAFAGSADIGKVDILVLRAVFADLCCLIRRELPVLSIALVHLDRTIRTLDSWLSFRALCAEGQLMHELSIQRLLEGRLLLARRTHNDIQRTLLDCGTDRARKAQRVIATQRKDIFRHFLTFGALLPLARHYR